MSLLTAMIAIVAALAVVAMSGSASFRQSPAWQRTAKLGRRLRPYWWALALVACALVFGIIRVAGDYGKAQTASNPGSFRDIVPADDAARYAIAAAIDIAFAASYGLLAVAVAPILRSWGGNLRRIGTIGCGLVVMGALLDEFENVVLLLNLARRSDVGDLGIDVMTAVGPPKWALGIGGSVLVLLVVLVRVLWPTMTRDHIRAWLRLSWVPYGLYTGVLVAFVGAAAAHQRWMFIILVPALMVCGSWLNGTVWRSREEFDERPQPVPIPDLGPPRLVLAAMQLVAGASVVALGVSDPGILGDTSIFLGLALVIMSLGALLSELRQNRRLESVRGRALLGAAVGLLVAAAAVDSGRALLLLIAAGIVLAEVGTELVTEDYYRRGLADLDEQSDRRRRRWSWTAVGLVVVVTIAMVGLGAHPAHAIAIVVALAALVVMASVDGDALVVVLLLALALVVSTTPSDRDVAESVEAIAGEPYILVLGDSYTSGEGAAEYLPGTNEIVRDGSANDQHTNECRQAPTAWAFQLVERVADEPIEEGPDGPFPTRVLFLACSGAVSENIDTELRIDAHGDQHGPAELAMFLEREPELGPPALVIIGIGGNDAGFGDLGQACVGPGNCAEVAEQFFRNRPERLVDPPPEGQSEALSDIADDLSAAYGRIRDLVGTDVPIVAASYPLPFTAEGPCAGAFVDADERVFINRFAERLNVTIREIGEPLEVSYMDIAGSLASEGVQLCSGGLGRTGLNFVAFGSKGGSITDSLTPKNWVHNSLHPNARGHQAMANAAYRWFSDYWPDGDVGAEPGPEPSVDEILGQLEDRGVKQCDPQADSLCSVESTTWTTEEAKGLYRRSILPIGLLAVVLWVALLPLVVTGRRSGMTLLSVLQHRLGGRWRALISKWNAI